MIGLKGCVLITFQTYRQKLGDSFSLITAFSRDGREKVYVQHRLEEHKKEVNELLQQGAYFYVCGDAAHMAREVNSVLGKIIASERGLPEEQGHEMVKRLRNSNLYQVRDPVYQENCWRILTSFAIGGRVVIESWIVSISTRGVWLERTGLQLPRIFFAFFFWLCVEAEGYFVTRQGSRVLTVGRYIFISAFRSGSKRLRIFESGVLC